MMRLAGWFSCLLNLLIFTSAVNSENGRSEGKTDRSFVVDTHSKTFLKDGFPFNFISGSMHYNRIPFHYWRDRLMKAKAAGLDAIQFYIPWNFHEPEEGEFRFQDDQDVFTFIKEIHRLEMLTIARVGPYICAEWNLGGLPPWLLSKNPAMKLRSSSVEFIQPVRKWFDVLLPKLRPLLYTQGGPIIMVQMENEYGSYGLCEGAYMSEIYEIARGHLGNEVILYTTDGNSLDLIKCGSTDDRYFPTIDFGPEALGPNVSVDSLFKSLNTFRSNLPWVNSEYYTGWFDAWGKGHHRTRAEPLAHGLAVMLRHSNRVSVNMYMFHGGSNFGLWSRRAVTSSYDFDAPISEAGDLTYKYWLVRRVIAEVKRITPVEPPGNTTKVNYGRITMRLASHLLTRAKYGQLEGPPRSMEQMHQYDGLMIYYTTLPSEDKKKMILNITRFSDIAHVFLMDQDMQKFHFQGSLVSGQTVLELQLPTGFKAAFLAIMTENLGYVINGQAINEQSTGILGDVYIGDKIIDKWTMVPMKNPFEYVLSIRAGSQWLDQGAIYTGSLDLSGQTAVFDTFLQMDSFTRGMVAVNGKILGRYDQLRGPQLRLFIPGPMLMAGEANLVTVIELERVGQTHSPPCVSFHETMKWT